MKSRTSQAATELSKMQHQNQLIQQLPNVDQNTNKLNPRGILDSSAMRQKPQNNSNNLVIEERLRQAKLSFNLAFIMTAATAFISLGGIGLLFAGKIQEGAVTTTGGATVSACCAKLAKDANDRLDKLAAELDDKQD